MIEYRNDIVLASSSPRRKEMFETRGIPVEIFPSCVDENIPMPMSPQTVAMYLAFTKAMDVASKKTGLIIAADTIVVYDGRIIGKPADKHEAFSILSKLRNDSHKVITGVCIIDTCESVKRCLYEVTDVYFTDYSDGELEEYVSTDEPYDKAGGYAIQETFGKYIKEINGDRDNVIGFPMGRVEPWLISDRE